MPVTITCSTAPSKSGQVRPTRQIIRGQVHKSPITLKVLKSQVRDLQNLPVERIMGAHFAVVRSMNVGQMAMGFSRPWTEGPTAAFISSDGIRCVRECADYARLHPGLGARRKVITNQGSSRVRVGNKWGSSAESVGRKHWGHGVLEETANDFAPLRGVPGETSWFLYGG